MPASASLHDATVVLDDRPVLRGVSIDLGPGLAILRGLNGAGKTTLLRALAGLVPLSRGSRRVLSAPLFLGHRPMLLRGLTPRENLIFLATFRGRAGADVAAALRRWGLDEVMDRPIERLSAGQRRRASLARLDTEPEAVVLLDEPFADLDVDAVSLLRATIDSAVARGQSVLMATHLHHELDEHARVLLGIADGVLTSDGARA
jgi:heme exporter protein A